MRELTDLIKEVKPEVRRRDVRLNFALIYPDKRGRPILREVMKYKQNTYKYTQTQHKHKPNVYTKNNNTNTNTIWI